jgi:hypothetical protein
MKTYVSIFFFFLPLVFKSNLHNNKSFLTLRSWKPPFFLQGPVGRWDCWLREAILENVEVLETKVNILNAQLQNSKVI